MRWQRHSVQLPLQAVGCERGMLQHAQSPVPLHACKGRTCHLHTHHRMSWTKQVELLTIVQELPSWLMHKRINLEWEHATIAPLLSSWLSCAHIASRRSMTTEVLATT